MAITKSTADLAVIAKLGNKPNQDNGFTAAQMKAKYDEGAKALQVEVNTICDEVDALVTVIDDNLVTHKTSNDHDGRYYTETELNGGQLDTRYYTETEVDAKDEGLAGVGRTTQTIKGNHDNIEAHKISTDHNTIYYTETELNAGQLDNRYYTESESDAKFDTFVNITTNRKLSPTGDFTGTLNGMAISSAEPGLSTEVVNARGSYSLLRNKLDSYGVDVKDIGLIGNGVANDATLLNTWITSIGSNKVDLIVTSGTYLISTNVTFPANIRIVGMFGGIFKVGNGISFNGTNTLLDCGLWQVFDLSLGGTVGGSWNISEVYPEWFGAKGDGVTDDNAAIQLAINLISSGGIVNFQNRTYIYSNLKLYSNIVLVGVGKATILKVKANSTSTKSIELFNESQAKVRVEHLTLDGNKANQTIDIDGLYIDNNNNHDDYALSGFYDHYNNFNHLWIKSFTGHGFIIPRYTSHECRLDNLIVALCNKDGIHSLGNDNIITRCTCSGNGGHGFYIEGDGQRGVGNKAFYNTGTGFYFYNGNNTYSYNGLRATTFDHLESQENDSHGIYLENSRGTILTNVVGSANGKNDNTASNIFLNNSRYCMITGQCENSVSTGLARHALSVLGNRSVFNEIRLMMSGAGFSGNTYVHQNYLNTDTINSTNKIVFNGIEYGSKNAYLADPTLMEDSNSDGVANFLTPDKSTNITASYSINKIGTLTGQSISVTNSTTASTNDTATVVYRMPVVAATKISASARALVSDCTKVYGQVQVNAYSSAGSLLGQYPSTAEERDYAATGSWLTAAIDNKLIRDLCVVDFTLPTNTAYIKIFLHCAIKAQGYVGEVIYTALNIATNDPNFTYSTVLSGSKTFNPAFAATGTRETTTVTVIGAELGDGATASFSLDQQGMDINAYVSAINTVTCVFRNDTGGNVDLGSGTLKANVTK